MQARLLNPSAKLQAGEYRFAKPASTLEVFNRIERGDIYFFCIYGARGQQHFRYCEFA